MFEIDPVTLLMSCLLMCAFSVPFISHGLKNKKKNNLLITQLNELAQSIGATPTEIDTWRHRYAIGIDVNQGILTYVRHGVDAVNQRLELADFKKVNLIKNYQATTEKPKLHQLPEYVALELIPKASDTNAISLEIYDAEQYSDLLGETVLADKWLELVKNQLK
ncbi:hypothetical protein SYJ56_07840 [Algoriphagus sp. D3-2-R+10]|uniref:hypothetical protein n=1 Tax=Algoriphagus aurantiacus TaxID=3103948 RepID=UPI002B364AF8|nr:hypothetical protein [Algoriphagus sp. D3-2-R+10]MEB2775215.1 hypothetical protein [Algoriphagus sp. D3-2-R+10]